MYKDTENKKLSFVSYSTVPEGCRIDKAGVIATSDASVAANPDTFNVESSTFVRGDASDSSSHRYTWSKTKVNVGDTWYVRAYLVYTDKNGNTHEMFGDIQATRQKARLTVRIVKALSERTAARQ